MRAHLAFALALHRAAVPEGNACTSPFSVASALYLAATGAAGVTRDELVFALLGDKSGDLDALGAAFDAASSLEEPAFGEAQPRLAVSNTLWADDSVAVHAAFAQRLAVRTVPFRRDTEQARRLINADVAHTTHDLIPELLQREQIDASTLAALVNALYLKSGWRAPFPEHGTQARPFHGARRTVDVPTMSLVERLAYAHTDGWQVANLPAVGGVVASVLLPDGDLADAEAALDADRLAALLAAPRIVLVSLQLPRVDVRTQAELAAPLGTLGVRTLFTDDADLSGISSTPLAVDRVIHESVLRLDEQGLEGAAATAMVMRAAAMMRPDSPVPMLVDRPFLLLVRHAGTGVCYFLARLSQL